MADIWIFDPEKNDGFPYVTYGEDMPEKSQEKPYPLYLWRITPGTNSGYPYFLLQPPPAPVPVLPVPQQMYIQVFDMETDKTDLAPSKNGLAILTPSSCEITEVLNGEYSLRMTHPIDPDGKWQYIREENIIRALGQLFTIKTVTWRHTGSGSGEIEVFAEHIFYQIADPWILPFSEPVSSSSCYQIMLQGMTRAYHHLEDEFHQHEYSFSYASDWEWDTDYIFSNDDGRTVVDLLIGSGGITDVKGGELYRNNFYFRIEETMTDEEGNPMPTDAFDIRIGRNMSGISLTTDLTTLCTYYRGDFERSDGSWGWFAWAWKPEGFIRTQFPHHVVRSKNYSYDDRLDWDTVWERFKQDVTADFKKNCRPVISYEIDLADVSRNPDFQEQNPNYIYKPGCSGRVYDERLGGAVTLKITETVTDAITGDVLRVTIGSRQSFTRNASYPVILGIEAEIDGGELPLVDADGCLLEDADGYRLTEEVQNGS